MNALPPQSVDVMASMTDPAVRCSRLRFDVEDGEQVGAHKKDCAVSVVLPDGRVATLVVHSAEDAAALADARIARGDSDLYAADCKPVAHAVADALVAAGMGGS